MENSAHNETNYRWYILILGALTNALVIAAPTLCMPVLFDEISKKLELNLTQLGLIWGIGSLPAIVAALLGGALGDRFGPKRFIMVSCVLAGLAGMMRGLSHSFIELAITVSLFSFLTSAIPMIVAKNAGMWFSKQQLGLANGVTSMGMALGFMTGSMISASKLSPWLGGWQNVMLFYGAISVLLSIPWYFTRLAPSVADLGTGGATSTPSMFSTMSRVAQIRNIWLLGIAILGIGGCIQAMLGYLPLHLRDIGWEPNMADTAAATFHIASLICVLPIALWSDKLGARKIILIAASFFVMCGVGLLSIGDGILVWIAVVMAGMVRDGFMAVFLTMIVETEGVGSAYAGSAIGIVLVFSGLGNLLAPPLGNSLASVNPGLPFLFWAGIAALGSLGIYAAHERNAKGFSWLFKAKSTTLGFETTPPVVNLADRADD